jgi:hypothetical protein
MDALTRRQKILVVIAPTLWIVSGVFWAINVDPGGIIEAIIMALISIPLVLWGNCVGYFVSLILPILFIGVSFLPH